MELIDRAEPLKVVENYPVYYDCRHVANCMLKRIDEAPTVKGKHFSDAGKVVVAKKETTTGEDINVPTNGGE